jgi:NADPH:quinone reductase-like Zn-dependent oxidoreductase
MKAAVYKNYGPPSTIKIKEVETPTPKDTEILVRVHSSTVNRTDCGMRRAKPFVVRFFTGLLRPRQPISGTDFAGKIEAVGKKVTAFKVGDRLFGFDDQGLGSHAEYLVISEHDAIAKIPKKIAYKQAAASLEGAHYAINFVNKVKLKKGQRVLVNGATGAIGSAAVQLLKYRGCHVTAVCESKYTKIIQALGADEVINYDKEDFTKRNHTFHFVFDSVGKSTFGKCKKLLEKGGIYISSELGPRGENMYLPLLTYFSKKRVIFPIPVDRKKSVHLVRELLETGKFTPLIDREYPLDEIIRAFLFVETGQKIGNVVLKM